MGNYMTRKDELADTGGDTVTSISQFAEANYSAPPRCGGANYLLPASTCTGKLTASTAEPSGVRREVPYRRLLCKKEPGRVLVFGGNAIYSVAPPQIPPGV